jgi:hypothetical protein
MNSALNITGRGAQEPSSFESSYFSINQSGIDDKFNLGVKASGAASRYALLVQPKRNGR